MFHIYFHLVVCVDCLVFGLVVCVVPSLVLRNWCLVGMLGHVGHFLFKHLFVL